MILKVKAVNEEAIMSWHYYDGVEGFHVSLYPDGNALLKESNTWAVPKDVQYIEYVEQKIDTDSNKMLFMSFSSDATGPMHVFCNTECYLLNDLGKTIERLI